MRHTTFTQPLRLITWAALLLASLALTACGKTADYRDVVAIFQPVARDPLPIVEDPIAADNITDLEVKDTYTAALGAVAAGSFSPVDRHIALLGADGVLRVWDVDSGRLLAEPFDHNSPGFALAYSPDGTRLLSGGRSGGQDIVLIDTLNEVQIAGMSIAGYVASDAAWSPDGSRFALVSRGSSRIFFYTGDGESLTQRRPSGQWLWSTAYGETFMAVSNELGATYIYETKDYVFTHEFWFSNRSPGRDLEFSPDERLLMACHVDGTIRVFRMREPFEIVTEFVAHEYIENVVEGCRDGAFTVNGDVYLTVGDDGLLAGWDPTTGEQLYATYFQQPVLTVNVSPMGDLVAVTLADGQVAYLGLPGDDLAAGP